MANLLRTALIKDVHKATSSLESNSFTKLCQESLEQIKKTGNLNSFITICHEEALDKARDLDERWMRSDRKCPRSPLFGIPISVKDNFCTRNILTTCGSKMLSTFKPPYNATVVDKLIAADSIIVGKTNMDEFAMGSSSTTSYFGPAANNYMNHMLGSAMKPTQAKPSEWFMAGGSSTGSAVSVASGSCFASIGTDTGGSTRQPASLTGTVGFKPTYGLISRHGLIPLVHCLDVVSMLARSVSDVRLVFDAIIGQDENDLTSVDHNKTLVVDSRGKSPIRVGISDEFLSNCDNLSSEVSSRYEELVRLISNLEIGTNKFEIVNLELSSAKLATECYTIISSAEIASNMSCYDGIKYGHAVDPNDAFVLDGVSNTKKFNRDLFYQMNRDTGFGAEVKKRILLGNYFLLSGNRERYLTQALKLRRLISEEFDKAFQEERVDVILMPSTPTTSVSYENWLLKQDDNKLFREDYFLIPSNLANLPSISLPCGLSDGGLPFGMQLIGRKFHDINLLNLAELFESLISKRFV